MSLSPTRLEVLEALLLYESPVKPVQVTKELGKERRVIQMHLIGLVRMNYASSPKKGEYLISQSGKEALGLDEVTKEKALKILSPVSRDKAFHFYMGIGKPLHLYTYDLRDFCNKLGKVDAASLEFHICRGDFEAWFKSLGDNELARKTSLLKARKLTSEELRGRFHEMVESHCMMLSGKVG